MKIIAWVMVCLMGVGAVRGQTVVLSDTENFSDEKVIESFENIGGRGSNVQITSELVLPSGIVVAGQTPTGFNFSPPAIVNGGFFGLTGASPDVPDGTSYLGQGNPGLNDDGIVFVLPEDAIRVGAFVSTASSDPDGPVVLEAYNAAGQLLSSKLTRGVSSSGWATNFIGFENAAGIRSLRFDGFGGGVLRIDLLQYDPVPEPGMALCMLAAAAGCLLRRGRRNSA